MAVPTQRHKQAKTRDTAVLEAKSDAGPATTAAEASGGGSFGGSFGFSELLSSGFKVLRPGTGKHYTHRVCAPARPQVVQCCGLPARGRKKGGAERVQSAASPQAPPGGWLGPFGFFRLVTYTFLAGGIPAVLKKHSPMRTVLGLAEECCWHYCWHFWPRLGLVLAGSVGSKRASSCKDGPADRTPPGQSLTEQSRAEPEKSRRQFHFPDATAAFAAFAQLGASPDGFAASSPAVKDDAAGALLTSL